MYKNNIMPHGRKMLETKMGIVADIHNVKYERVLVYVKYF